VGIISNNDFRRRIDEIDEGIAKLFSERMRISADLARNNAKSGIAVIDPERERDKLETMLEKTDPDIRGYTADLYIRIFELNRSYLGSIVRDTDMLSDDSTVLGAGLPNESSARAHDTRAKATGSGMTNVTLIGMPGCGKTTIGRYLSGLLGFEFCDTDEIVSERTGKSIERILADDGEGVFRDLETVVLEEITKKRGCVIAAGEGVIKREDNRDILRRNSTIVFLDRTPAELLSDGLTLKNLYDLKSVYLERLPLYIEWSDYEVKTRGSVERTAQSVKDLLQRKA